MTTVSPVVDFAAAEVVEEEGRAPSAWRAILGSGEGRIGIGIGSMILFVIAFGRFFTPYPPDAIGVGGYTTGPSAAHLLGTDTLGFDVWSRVLFGARTSLVVGFGAVAISIWIGTTPLCKPYDRSSVPSGSSRATTSL